MTQYINTSAIMDAVRNAEMAAVDRVAQSIAASARQKAPIRKVFKEKAGHQRQFRPLTPLEKSLATRRAKLYYTNVQPNRVKLSRALRGIKSGRAELPVRGSANSPSKSRSLRLLGQLRQGRFQGRAGASLNGRGGIEPGAQLRPLLTARGAYEVRSGRAIHVTRTGQVRAGGALKASIHATEATVNGQGVQATVVAGIRYAKYVEFPTVHNAAQPFIRPALAEHRAVLRREMASEIKATLGG
jgi:HK97 gp10 family phage protein